MSRRAINPGSLRAAGFSPVLLVLILLVAGALGALWWVRSQRSGPDFTLGGAIFQAPADSISGLLLTTGGAQYRLDRGPDRQWSLSGATADFVDSRAMDALLTDLTGATGGALLPGTEIEDRRFEFNGPLALRLTVFGGERTSELLALGTVNPVTGNFYASGAGRPGCFPVTAGFRERIAGLPASVQLMTLLPRVGLHQVESILLWRNEKEHRLLHRGGRWWLLRGPEDRAFLDPVLRRYHELYADRTLTDEQGSWIQAAEDKVGALVYEVSEVIVRGIVPPAEADDLKIRWGLDHPWRRVELRGKGINPEPGSDHPDRLELVFGEPLQGQQIPVQRRGALLLADGLAAQTLDQPLGDLAYIGALTWRAVSAVGFEAFWGGDRILAGVRDPGPVIGDGRKLWRTTFPASGGVALGEDRRALLVGELMVNLDRMPILAVLPPVSDPGVLSDDQRVRIHLIFAEDGPPAADTFEVGFLQTDRLPPEVRSLVKTVSGEPAVALWRPADGQLLQVDTGVIVTLRNLRQLMPAAGN